MHAAHDLGGAHGFGRVVSDGAIFHADWEQRLFALTEVSQYRYPMQPISMSVRYSLRTVKFFSCRRWAAIATFTVSELAVISNRVVNRFA